MAGILEKFGRGAAGVVREASLEQVRSDIMEQRTRRLEELRQTQALELAQIKQGTAKVGQYNPGDYTPDSWAKFEASERKDPSVLKRYEAAQTVMIGGVPHVFDKTTQSYKPAKVEGGKTISAQDVAENTRIIGTGTEFGRGQGESAAGYENIASDWDVNRDFIVNNILKEMAPEDPNVKGLLEGTPGSSVSKAVQSGLSALIGNTDAANAQAVLEQYGAMILQGIPFAPGPQSDKELEQRAKVVSDQLENPNISPDFKVRILSNFIEWQDTRAAGYRGKAAEITGTPTQAQTPTGRYQIGQEIVGPDGKKYRVIGGDMNDPDVERI